MRIAFIDFIEWDYSPETPYQGPLGGVQSAVCYLSECLAQNGHKVFLINNHSEMEAVRGVFVIPLNVDQEILRNIFDKLEADVLIVIGSSSAGPQLKPLLPASTKLLFWTGHSHHQPHNEYLREKESADVWDGFAFVSDWQMNCFIEEFSLSPSKCINLRYGVAPGFCNLFADGPILSTKLENPYLLYSSTPFRGLDVLVESFPAIHAAFPQVGLKVFSSMKVYQKDEEERFLNLYETCKAMPGVDYRGSVAQPVLAQELAGALMLAYPNTYQETCCIAAMEAMASGCRIVTSALGALPETTAGFATLVSQVETKESIKEHFTQACIGELEAVFTDPDRVESSLREQVDYANREYNWDYRAQLWVNWLESL